MSTVPTDPRIYHITHVDNLPRIIVNGGLWSDAEILRRGGSAVSIGMSAIKQRRLTLPVTCNPGDYVGDHVPFYFCPRSIMLYLIHRANHPDLTYRGRQGSIVHLEADLNEVVRSVEIARRRWAFSLSNAGTIYAEFRNRLDQLGEVNWVAVAASDFRDPDVKEGKQAEFLVRGFFTWHLVRRIEVCSDSIKRKVLGVLTSAPHRPMVQVRPEWYY